MQRKGRMSSKEAREGFARACRSKKIVAQESEGGEDDEKQN